MEFTPKTKAILADCANDLRDIYETIKAIKGERYVQCLESIFTVTNIITYQAYLLNKAKVPEGEFKEVLTDGHTMGVVANAIPSAIIATALNDMIYAFAVTLSPKELEPGQILLIGQSLMKDLDTLMDRRMVHSEGVRKQ